MNEWSDGFGMDSLEFGKKVEEGKRKGDNLVHLGSSFVQFAYVEIMFSFHQKFIEHPGCATHSARC